MIVSKKSLCHADFGYFSNEGCVIWQIAKSGNRFCQMAQSGTRICQMAKCPKPDLPNSPIRNPDLPNGQMSKTGFANCPNPGSGFAKWPKPDLPNNPIRNPDLPNSQNRICQIAQSGFDKWSNVADFGQLAKKCKSRQLVKR
jgi:hypothetical protein